MEYDVFISHAHEDKDSVARPLTARLRELGVKVWLDEFELKLGDSLRRSVEHGLSQSKFGIVVLSRHFFRKEWTRRELDVLLSKEETAQKVILPIWHEITKEDVFKFSPLLADKLAASTEKGIEYVAQQVLSVVKSVEKEAIPLESAVAEITAPPAPTVKIEKRSNSLQISLRRFLSTRTLLEYLKGAVILITFFFLVFPIWYSVDSFFRDAADTDANSNTQVNANSKNINQAVTATPFTDEADSRFFNKLLGKNSKLFVKGCRLDIKPYIYCEINNGSKNSIIINAVIEIEAKRILSPEVPVLDRKVFLSLAPERLVDSNAEISGNPSKISLYRGDWSYALNRSKLRSEDIKVTGLTTKPITPLQ